MTMPTIPIPALAAPWTLIVRRQGRTTVLAEICDHSGIRATVELERCAAGRLRAAYPANAHDIEIRLVDEASSRTTDVLRVLASAIEVADPHCRRIIFAAPAGDWSTIAGAQAGGFRYVVDVDVPGAELSLLAAEPDWVTAIDMDLDRVPGT
ncbi:hypothetical protein [Nocardia sp. NPDC004860]|uniref:hypothetical protein n=1 Tax=Nocardia sp. NPDC004860 TaxID=3154557 RepID=UPI0033AB2639